MNVIIRGRLKEIMIVDVENWENLTLEGIGELMREAINLVKTTEVTPPAQKKANSPKDEMTPRELAEKIFKISHGHKISFDSLPDIQAMQQLESLLAEALGDAQIECIETHLCHSKAVRDAAVDEARAAAYEEGFTKGREQGAFECRHAKDIALEEAAKVAESLPGMAVPMEWMNCAKRIAKRIRALKAGVKA